jgi:hypothetical protein
MPASSDAGSPLQGPKCTWGQTTSALLSLQVSSWLSSACDGRQQQLVLNQSSIMQVLVKYPIGTVLLYYRCLHTLQHTHLILTRCMLESHLSVLMCCAVTVAAVLQHSWAGACGSSQQHMRVWDGYLALA